MRKLLSAIALVGMVAGAAAQEAKKDITVTFTEPELNALEALLNEAVKATGLRGAEAGLVLSKKIQAARGGTPTAQAPGTGKTSAQIVPGQPPPKQE